MIQSDVIPTNITVSYARGLHQWNNAVESNSSTEAEEFWAFFTSFSSSAIPGSLDVPSSSAEPLPPPGSSLKSEQSIVNSRIMQC